MNEKKFNEITASLQDLRASKIEGYGASRIPSEIVKMVNAYLELDGREKKNVRELIGRDNKLVFLAFAERMASLAIRKKSCELLTNYGYDCDVLTNSHWRRKGRHCDFDPNSPGSTKARN